MPQASAYAAQSATTPLGPARIERREPGPDDVRIEIAFCGVCHSDVHTARSEWPGTHYPVVPGHEIVGKVTAVGDRVSGFGSEARDRALDPCSSAVPHLALGIARPHEHREA